MRVIGGGARGPALAADHGRHLWDARAAPRASRGSHVDGPRWQVALAWAFSPDFSIAEKLTPIVDTVQPNPALGPLYDRLYAVFNRAYELIAPLYDELAEF